MKKFTKQEIVCLYGQVTMGEISFSRMVEIINKRVSEAKDIPEEPKKGDLAIFWDDDKNSSCVRFYDTFISVYHYDIFGNGWANAIKFESKEQYERLIKGEI